MTTTAGARYSFGAVRSRVAVELLWVSIRDAPMKRNVTINDIALEVGVSKATVSRVLNGEACVNETTRKKVLEMIEQRKYTPSAVARNLSKQKSDTIGVLIPAVDNVFFGKILRTVIDATYRQNLNLLVFHSDNNAGKEKQAFETLRENRIKGLIFTPAEDYESPGYTEEVQRFLQELNTPVVMVDRNIAGLCCDSVHFDDEEGVYNATMALIKAGHRKIGIVNAALSRSLPKVRQNGYEKALRETDMEVEERYSFLCNGDYDQEEIYLLSKQLLAMADRPTAVVTCNNSASLGFLQALHERGERIARDIDCIGLDQIEALNIIGMNYNYIVRNEKKIGEQAINLLLDRIAHPNKPIKEIVLSPVLVVNELKGV